VDAAEIQGTAVFEITAHLSPQTLRKYQLRAVGVTYVDGSRLYISRRNIYALYVREKIFNTNVKYLYKTTGLQNKFVLLSHYALPQA
jgi:hypothetical protein